MPPNTLEVILDAGRAQTLLHPLRLRLVQELEEPDSAAGLSRRLGVPRQKLNYHLRQLEKEGFLELVDERRKGNCFERMVRATARSYLVDPAALGGLAADPEHVRDRFSATYLVAVAARAIRELAATARRAGREGKRLATFTLQTEVRFASAADRNAFAEELAAEVARLAAKYHDEKRPGGRRFRFFVGGYPAVDLRPDHAEDGRAASGDASVAEGNRRNRPP